MPRRQLGPLTPPVPSPSVPIISSTIPIEPSPFETWRKTLPPKKSEAEKRPKNLSRAQLNRAVGELDVFRRSGDWTSAKPVHFVALYIAQHERVYGVTPPELTPEIAHRARFCAATMLRTCFSSDPVEMADYFWWTWKRESEREAARRAGKFASDGRIGWYAMFTRSKLYGDYRVAIERAAFKPPNASSG